MSGRPRPPARLVGSVVVAVALVVGPGAAGAAAPVGAGGGGAPLGASGAVAPLGAGAGLGRTVTPAPVVEPCPATQLPLGAAADDPTAPRAALPSPSDAVRGDELAGPGLLVPPGVPAPPPVPATSWLVADLDTGQVLAACNAHVPFAPASTLKVLTALALLPGLDPATVHTAGPASAQVVGSRAGIVQGSQYTVQDLAHGLMLSSGNDAAVALGELVGPQVALDRMTQVARAVGAWSTVPRTTNGLDAEGQVSTAHDLAVLARAALAEPRVAGPASTRRYDFPAAGAVGDPDRETYEIQTSSRLLRNYDGATGLKSGFTRAAGGAYVGTAERDGRRYVATVMRAQDSAWRQSATLLDWAFASGTAAAAAGGVGTLATPGTPPETSRTRDQDVPAAPTGTAAPSVPATPDATAGTDAADPAPSAADDPLGAALDGRRAPQDGARSTAAAPPPGVPGQLGVLGATLLLAATGAVAGAVVVRRRARTGPERPDPSRPPSSL